MSISFTTHSQPSYFPRQPHQFLLTSLWRCYRLVVNKRPPGGTSDYGYRPNFLHSWTPSHTRRFNHLLQYGFAL